jgi:hypothetical protein
MSTPLPFINFGPHGTFTPSGAFRTTAADIDALAAYLRKEKTKKLAIHFHGGLVSEKSGVAIAEKMVEVYTNAGSLPLTIVWETGLIETFRYNLKQIHQTELFRKILIWVLKKAAGRLGFGIEARGVGVEMTTAQIELELSRDVPFETLAIGEGARGGAGPVSMASLGVVENDVAGELEGEIDPAFLALAAETGSPAMRAAMGATSSPGGRDVVSALKAAWAIAKIVTRVIRRFVQNHDHGFYPTVVEEILRAYYVANLGEWVWGKMKDAGEDMWKSNDGIAGDARHAGRYLIEALAPVQAETGLVIDLIGHSAGAVAICRLFKASSAAGIPIRIRTVALLAPAVRSDLFDAEITQHPERFSRLRIYTMSDAFETKDRMAGPLYTRSLLYFISGVLEADCDVPIVGMARYLSGAAPYDAPELLDIRRFVHAVPDGLVLSKTAPGAPSGCQSESCSHGDFCDDSVTRTSLTYFLSH